MTEQPRQARQEEPKTQEEPQALVPKSEESVATDEPTEAAAVGPKAEEPEPKVEEPKSE